MMDLDADQRIRQYFNVDGLFELVFGTIFLLIALTSSLSEYFSSIPPYIVFIPIFVAIPLLSRSVLTLKQRLTYPRTGYATARYRHPRYLVFIFFALLLLVTAIQGFLLPSLEQGLPLLLGIMIAVLLLWIGAGLVRFYYLAAAALALGVGLTWLPLGELLGGIIFCVVIGLLLLVSGASTLRNYLKSHQEK